MIRQSELNQDEKSMKSSDLESDEEKKEPALPNYKRLRNVKLKTAVEKVVAQDKPPCLYCLTTVAHKNILQCKKYVSIALKAKTGDELSKMKYWTK